MDWITMFGAIVAAVAAIANLWFTYSNGRDSIHVRYGGVRYYAIPAAELYVVNDGKHPVYISDFGFIKPDGSLFSIPYYDQTEGYMDNDNDPNRYVRGTTSLNPRETFSIGMSYNDEVIGAYAKTSTQDVIRVHMIASRWRPVTFFLYLKAKFFGKHY